MYTKLYNPTYPLTNDVENAHSLVHYLKAIKLCSHLFQAPEKSPRTTSTDSIETRRINQKFYGKDHIVLENPQLECPGLKKYAPLMCIWLTNVFFQWKL